MDELTKKVINGLTCCLNENDPMQCEKCRYRTNFLQCVKLLREDAISLLKAQEPRVMTLEEVCAAVQKNAILFTECEKENQWVTEGMAHFSDLALFNDSKYNNCKITFIRHTYDGTQKNEWYVYLKNYNKTWRCWTSRPTDEQREKVKWE